MNYTHITNVSKQRILIFRRNMPSISLALGQSITIPTNVIDRSQIMNLKDKRFIRVYSTGESVTISDTGSIRDGINAVASSGNVDINQGAMATALAIKNTQSLIDLNIANAAATPAVNEASIKAAVQAAETQARNSIALAATPPVATGGDAATIAGLIEAQAAEVGGAVESYATLIKTVWPPSWVSGTAYDVGDMVFGSGSPYHTLLKCVQAGNTGLVEPNWETVTPDVGDTVLDGTVIWERVSYDALVTPTVYNAPANAVGFTVFCYDHLDIFGLGSDPFLKCEITFDDDSTLSQVLTEGVAAYKLGLESFYMAYLSKTKNIKKITFLADGFTEPYVGSQSLGRKGHVHWVTVGNKEGVPSGDGFLSLT